MSDVSAVTSPALELMASLVLGDGRRWGAAATEWQWTDARAVLAPGEGGPLQHFETRPRGGSKTEDAGGVAASLLATEQPSRAQGYLAAADADQAGLLLGSIAGFVGRTPGLSMVLRVEARRVVNVKTDAALVVLPADGPSAFGLRPWLVAVDEIAQWPDTPNARMVWEALLSAVPKVRGCRLFVLTSAGAPSHWSYRILEHARRSSRWRVSETPGPVPWIDEAALEEQRQLLTPSQYARLHLNEWTELEDKLATVDDVRACASLDGPQAFVDGRRYAVGVDLGLKRDRACAVVAHTEPIESRWDGWERVDEGVRVVVDRKFLWRPSRLRPVDLGEVERALLAVHRSFARPDFLMDPWQGAYLGQRLREQGVRINEFAFNAQSVGRLAATLYGLLRDRRLALDATDDELLDELAHVQLRETSPGQFRMDHSANRHDDQAVALGLVAVQLLSRPAPAPIAQMSYRMADPSRGGGRDRAHEELVAKWSARDPEFAKRMAEARLASGAGARR